MSLKAIKNDVRRLIFLRRHTMLVNKCNAKGYIKKKWTSERVQKVNRKKTGRSLLFMFDQPKSTKKT